MEDEKKTRNTEQAADHTAGGGPAEDAQPHYTKEELLASSVPKKAARFPYAAFFMCVGGAVGHLAGTYLFDDLMTCTGIGIGAGIIAAILYGRQKAAREKAEQEALS